MMKWKEWDDVAWSDVMILLNSFHTAGVDCEDDAMKCGLRRVGCS